MVYIKGMTTMTEHKPPIPAPKIRLLRYLPLLIVLGLAVHLLIPQIAALEKSWLVVQKMSWWAVMLAVIAQVFSYLGSGFTLHAILKSNQQDLSTPRGALITMASYSIGLVAGGWVGAAAATYGWIHRENQDANTAMLAGTLPAMLNNAVLAGVAVVGVVYLIIVHELSRAQLIGFGIVLLVLSLVVIGIVAGLRSPGLVEELAVRLFGRWAALHHKVYEPQGTITSVRQFAHAWDSLSGKRWLQPALGAITNIGFDMLTLYFLFIATGYPINLGILFAGYGLPFILGKLAFMFPGGVGVMEGSMVAMYENLKVPNEISVVVILGYRLFSFWLPSLLGFIAGAYLLRSQENPNQN
jgi:uncharacterized protein (TIRG00374 family)